MATIGLDKLYYLTYPNIKELIIKRKEENK